MEPNDRRTKPRVSDILRFFVIGIGVVASIATSAAEGGDRSSGGDGECFLYCEDDNPGPSCPAGEQCSDLTPDGLFFAGMVTGDMGPFLSQWAHPTAVGGIQTIRVFWDRDATMPLDLPFAANLSSMALSIVGQDTSSVTLAAQSSGQPKLRIAEPETALLYDRITVESYPADRMQLVPAGKYLFHDQDLRDGDTAFVLLAGKTSRVTTQLLTASDLRVVDESMRFDLSANITSDPQGFADTVAVTPTTAGTVNVVARSGDKVGYMPVTAVSAADRIDSSSDTSPLILRIAEPRTLCFRAMAGDAAVVNVDWTYQSSGDLNMAQADDEVAAGCIELTGTEIGNARLIVSGAGVSSDFTVGITDNQASARRESQAIEPVDRGLAGERAATALR